MARIRLENVSRRFTRDSSPIGVKETLARGAQDAAQFEQADAASAPPGRALAALESVSLTIPDGQTVAILGPSGSGKSTLLRVVAGLDMEYTGDVFYDERNMRDVPPRERYIGMVFQNYALYPHFHGQNNLKFFFWVRRTPDAEAEERIRVTSEIMGYGFNQLLGRKPGTLSGGQQQRLGIARAIVRNPRLFLFDEPLSNLDAKLRSQTRIEIKRLLRRFAITTLYVTHDQEEAIALGDRLAILRAGRVEQVGPYTELYAHPANAFVAGFLGAHPMNLLAGTVTAAGMLRLGPLSLPLPPAALDRYVEGQQLTLGVRPESLRLAAPDAHSGGLRAGELHVGGEVETVEPDFSRRQQFVRVRTDAGILTAVDATNEPLAVSQQVGIAIPMDDLYWFDGATGTRIAG
jgi:ABC-type sugar transport system ATPase subunit